MFREPRIEIPAHLDFIRRLPCLITGGVGVEACHIRFACRRAAKRETGKAEKPHDFWTVPMAAAKHREQHSMSEEEFWRMWQIDPIPVAALLFTYSSLKLPMEERLELARKVCRAATLGDFPYASD